MRGSPILRSLFMLAALLAAALPLWRMTHAAAPGADLLSAEESTATPPVTIEMRFAHPPTRWSLFYLGKPLARDHTQADETLTPTLAFPPEGIDLQLTAEWAKGTPATAVRVRVTGPDGKIHEQTTWSDRPLDTVLTFR